MANQPILASPRSRDVHELNSTANELNSGRNNDSLPLLVNSKDKLNSLSSPRDGPIATSKIIPLTGRENDTNNGNSKLED